MNRKRLRRGDFCGNTTRAQGLLLSPLFGSSQSCFVFISKKSVTNEQPPPCHMKKPRPSSARSLRNNGQWHEAYKVLADPAKAGVQARYVNRIKTDTATALHIACQYNDTPVTIVKRLLEENPDAALYQTGDGGQTPLYIATIHSSDAIVRLLLKACPRATSIPDTWSGYVPLHRSCTGWYSGQGFQPEKIRILLMADPSQLTTKNKHGLTPLDSFFSTFNRVMRETSQTNSFFRDCFLAKHMISSFDTCSSIPPGATVLNFLISANDLLYTYIHGVFSREGVQDQNWLMLHATLRVRSCPWVFFKFARQAFIEQVNRPDMEGNLPLHIASSFDSLVDGAFYECHACRKSPIYGTRHHHKKHMDVYCTNCTSKFDCSADQYYPVIPADKCTSAIEDLLKLYPQASKTTNLEGRLPLHLAIDAGKLWTTGVKLLVQSYPEALDIPDTKTNLYPFMLAAAADPDTGDTEPVENVLSGTKNFAAENQSHLGDMETVLLRTLPRDTRQLDTIFQLLKADPSWFQRNLHHSVSTAFSIDH